MKLGIVTTSFRPCQWYSGISNAAYLMANRLHEKHDFDVTVYAPELKGAKKIEQHRNFLISRFKTDFNLFNGYSISFEASRMIAAGSFDLIHSFHYGYFPATVGFRQAKKKHIPHFFTAAYHPPSSKLNRKLLKLYDFSNGAKIIKNSAGVLPFNNNERMQLSKIAKGRFHIVPCPINHRIFRPKQQKDSKLTVTFVGAMEPWKGPRIAFDIFSQIAKERKDVKFIFVGNGMLPHQTALFDKLSRMADKRFTFTRNLTTEQLSNVYNMTDVLVLPTLYESFGCILAESMMCGTPVVSTKVGAVPETVGNGGILVNYGDWDGMKEKVSHLLDNNQLRKSLSKKALRHSRQYRDDVVVDKIYSIYKKSLK